MDTIFHRILEILANRLLHLFMAILCLFCFLFIKMFHLQIVNGQENAEKATASTIREVTVQAPRGGIYDRYGRPLAENEVDFVVKIDNNISYESDEETSANTKLNNMIYDLVQLLDQNNETVLDEIPVSKEKPYHFLFNSKSAEQSWKKNTLNFKEDNEKNMNMTAEEVYDYLKTSVFEIADTYTEDEARKIMAVRYAIYVQRYKKFQPATIALQVSNETVAAIEENKEYYLGVYIDTESLRIYPEGEYFSHIIGYTRLIDETELSKAEFIERGYVSTDIVGKTGLEKSMEFSLNGTDGLKQIEVDYYGRQIGEVISETPTIAGDKVFLTLDRDLQVKTFNILENTLKDVLVSKLNSSNRSSANSIPIRNLFTSMVTSTTISTWTILEAPEDTTMYQLRSYLANEGIFYDSAQAEGMTSDEQSQYQAELIENAKQALKDGINQGSITMAQMLFVMYEQGVIDLDEELQSQISNGRISALSVINQKLESGDLRPYQTNLDPSTGSVVVVDVHSGSVLAAVTYPSYDNNLLVNNFDYDYYLKLSEDLSSPFINRAFNQPKPPGSTFKMLSAIAALESGIISPTDTIRDLGAFTKAGMPYAHCWIYTGSGGTHGSINVTKAIEVSCNYFFYEVAYRMGNAANNNRLESIETLNYYMDAFGLNDKTGVEIGEHDTKMASPEYKENFIKSQNPDATTSQTRWVDGDTIRVAIGQSYNNYTVANMAKYIATLANGGTRYRMHLVDKTITAGGSIEKVTPEVEHTIDIKEENLKAVYQGMLNVTTGSQGTIRGVFSNFPIAVGAKTGTAEEAKSRASHTWFVAFAPYDDPQIAIAVMIPYGEHSSTPAAIVAKEVIAEYMGLNEQSDISVLENKLSQ